MSNAETSPENESTLTPPTLEAIPEPPEEVAPTSASEETEHELPAPEPLPLLWGAVGTGLCFVLVGTLISLRDVAIYTLPHILQPGPYVNFQEVDDSLPVPRLLEWNLSQIDNLVNLKSLPWITWGVLFVALLLALWVIALFVLNPTFRLILIGRTSTPRVPVSEETAPAAPILAPSFDSNSSAEAESLPQSSTHIETDPSITAETTPETTVVTPLNTSHVASVPIEEDEPSAITLAPATVELNRALTLLLALGIPLALLWFALGWLGDHTFAGSYAFIVPLLRFEALGAVLWLGFHRDGAAGNFASANAPFRPRNPGKLLVFGALYGLCVCGLVHYVMPGPLDSLLLNYQAMGTFHREYWSDITLRYLLMAGSVWFSAGILLYLMGRPSLRPPQRLALVSLPVIAVLLAWWAHQPLTPARLAQDKDMRPAVMAAVNYPYNPKYPSTGVPDGPQAGLELARSAHIRVGEQPTQPTKDMIVFYPEAPVTIEQQGITEDGLSAESSSAAPVLAFLKQRHYQTALSWIAIKHLFNVGTIHFDLTSAIAACLMDLENCPHMAQINSTLRYMLFTCSASPANLALLDRWGNSMQYMYPDRASLRMMGDLYVRFGQVSKALEWYRRAEMPKSFMVRIRSEKPLFHTGVVEGQVILNGHPLSGVQVGLLPHRMNGLPRDIEPALLKADYELIHRFGRPPFPPFHPRPFAFRLIDTGTTTDANGNFKLDNLTEGQYSLVLALPPDVRVQLPFDPRLKLAHPLPLITPRYEQPTISLNKIVLTYPTASATSTSKPAAHSK